MMMAITDVFRQLLRDLKSQKLRTTLTTFGILWGTVAVSLLLAFGQGLHQQLIRSIAGLGDRIVIAFPARTSIPYAGLGRGRKVQISEEDIAAVEKEARDLFGISGEYYQNLKIHQGDKTMMMLVSGISPIFGEMRNMVPQVDGRFVNQNDMDKRRRVIFLGDKIAQDIFDVENPVGRTLMIADSPFLVIGVLKTKSQDSSYNSQDKDCGWIPSTTYRAITGAKYVDNLIYRASTPAGNKSLTKEVTAILGRRLHFDPKDSEALMVWDTTEMFEFMDAFMLGFQLFLGIVGSLTLIVGGIGISNIMNVVVEERTREIGIKMALGARSGYVMKQFLLETLLLTGLGGAIGLLITQSICALVTKLSLTEYIGVPEVSLEVAILTATILGAVGLLAGFFPARDASHLDPVVAMKL